LFHQALAELINIIGQNDSARAIEYAHQAVLADPLCEETHCHLIRLYLATGQSSAAIRQYR
jgi:DNA-binding SARP family transcriptional activator